MRRRRRLVGVVRAKLKEPNRPPLPCTTSAPLWRALLFRLAMFENRRGVDFRSNRVSVPQIVNQLGGFGFLNAAQQQGRDNAAVWLASLNPPLNELNVREEYFFRHATD